MRSRLFTVIAAWAALGGTAAHAQAAAPCVPAAEAEAAFLYLAPALLKAVRDSCAPALPKTAYMVATPSLITRYEDAAKGTQGDAIKAFAKIGGPEAAPFLEPAMLDMMAGMITADMLKSKIKPADCGAVDQALMLLDPLPPRNAAGLVVLLLQLATADDAKKGKKSKFDICPLSRP